MNLICSSKVVIMCRMIPRFLLAHISPVPIFVHLVRNHRLKKGLDLDLLPVEYIEGIRRVCYRRRILLIKMIKFKRVLKHRLINPWKMLQQIHIQARPGARHNISKWINDRRHLPTTIDWYNLIIKLNSKSKREGPSHSLNRKRANLLMCYQGGLSHCSPKVMKI